MVQARAHGLSHPLRLDHERGLAVLDVEATVRALLDQILFTEPGERVNRPSFGVGVERALFEPNGPFLASRLRLALEENAYAHLGPDVEVLKLDVRADDETLAIDIVYQLSDRPVSPQFLKVKLPLEGVR